MHVPNFPQRLKAARHLRGLSIRGLCIQLANKISRQAISQYENGHMQPSRENYLLLCEALEVTPDYFMRDVVELKEIEFRKLIHLLAKEKNRVEAEAADFLSRFLELEQLLGMENNFINPIPNNCVGSWAEVEKVVMQLRDEWLLGEDPIPNVLELLEEKGIKVCEIIADDAFSGMAAKSPNEDYIIVLNNSKDVEVVRKRFTALHELAHIILNFNARTSEKEKEKLCHYFAGAMLFPKQRVFKELGTKRNRIHFGEFLVLKSQYGISIQAILYRLRQLEVISEYHYRRQMHLINLKGWKKKEPGNFPGHEHSQRMMQLLYRGIAEEIISTSKAASLLGINLSEFRKRIIQPVQAS